MSITIQDIKEALDGCEIRSITMEGVVGFNRGKCFRGGEEIFPTDKQIKRLWKEYLREELGTFS
jgi:nitrogen regulatory protein PII